MTYQDAKKSPEARWWTIRMMGTKYQPVYKGRMVGIAHETENAARTFIACQIAYRSLPATEWRQDKKNELYRDFDLC